MKNLENNLAFVDGQNLYFGITKCHNCAKKLNLDIKKIKFTDCTCGSAWKIDLTKFRVYLNEKYNINEAYYFLGYLDEKNNEIYKNIQKAGFIIIFKEHTSILKTKKKGNVDADIVFEIMKNLNDNNEFSKIVLVSGDGDYKKLLDYLIEKDKFKKILFPNKIFASSLYDEFGSEYFDYLDNIRFRITK